MTIIRLLLCATPFILCMILSGCAPSVEETLEPVTAAATVTAAFGLPTDTPAPTTVPPTEESLSRTSPSLDLVITPISPDLTPSDIAQANDYYRVVSDEESLRVHTQADGLLLWSLRFREKASFSKSPDERWIVAGVEDTYYVLEAATEQLRKTIESPGYGQFQYQRVYWSPDNMLMIMRNISSAGLGYELALINPDTGADTYIIEDQEMDIGHVLWTPDGRYLITANPDGGNDNLIVVRDAATGMRLHDMVESYEGKELPIGNLHLSPDGSMLAATYGMRAGDFQYVPGLTVLWELATGKKIYELEYPGMWDSRFSPDGSRIAVAATAHNHDLLPTLAIWDTASGEKVVDLQVNVTADYWYLHDLEWSPDGRLLAGIVNTQVYLWDAHTGQHLQSLEDLENPFISKLEFYADGTLVAMNSEEDYYVGHVQPEPGSFVEKYMIWKITVTGD